MEEHLVGYPDALPDGHARGRGAQVNPPNRFDPIRLEILGEHLDEVIVEHPDGVQIPTRVYRDKSRTIINKVQSKDMMFDWTINPYRGCEHGCIYCYARPTHETFGMSCGIDFETKIFAKTDAAELLRRELARPGWKGEPIVMSGITDPYQPIERSLRITRGVLEVLAEHSQPISIITKNRLVTRDIDLLSRLAEKNAVRVALSITTLDAKLAQKMEPRASAPRERLRAVRDLTDAGVPVMVMTAPIVPALNDAEIPALLQAAKEHGAVGAGWVMMKLPWQVKDVFVEWVHREFPDRAHKVLSQIREMRGGKLNDPTPHVRQRGTGARAQQIGAMFDLWAKKLGLDGPRRPLSRDAFRRPGERSLWE